MNEPCASTSDSPRTTRNLLRRRIRRRGPCLCAAAAAGHARPDWRLGGSLSGPTACMPNAAGHISRLSIVVPATRCWPKRSCPSRASGRPRCRTSTGLRCELRDGDTVLATCRRAISAFAGWGRRRQADLRRPSAGCCVPWIGDEVCASELDAWREARHARCSCTIRDDALCQQASRCGVLLVAELAEPDAGRDAPPGPLAGRGHRRAAARTVDQPAARATGPTT